jgi:hypothetical protein
MQGRRQAPICIGPEKLRISGAGEAFPDILEVRVAEDPRRLMTTPQPPQIQLVKGPEYRENYANSVQVRVNLWDFFLSFGVITQTAADAVAIHNFQGVYLSPQQAKALLNILQQNVSQYESAFGEIRLEPRTPDGVLQ